MNCFLDEFIEVAEFFFQKPLEFQYYMTQNVMSAQEKVKE